MRITVTDTNMKCVIIVDEDLPLGLIANTVGILGMSLGQLFSEVIGPDVSDGSGYVHKGITTAPVPILKSSSEVLKKIRTELYNQDYEDVLVLIFLM